MLKRIVIIGLVALVGAAGGYAYYYYVGCNSGTCAIAASPLFATLLGAAVGGSLGMVAASRLAVRRGLFKTVDAERLINLLRRLDLPISVEHELPVDKLFEAMKQDKKIKSGKIKFVLPTSLGSCRFVDDLSEDEIKKAIKGLRKN